MPGTPWRASGHPVDLPTGCCDTFASTRRVAAESMRPGDRVRGGVRRRVVDGRVAAGAARVAAGAADMSTAERGWVVARSVPGRAWSDMLLGAARVAAGAADMSTAERGWVVARAVPGRAWSDMLLGVVDISTTRAGDGGGWWPGRADRSICRPGGPAVRPAAGATRFLGRHVDREGGPLGHGRLRGVRPSVVQSLDGAW